MRLSQIPDSCLLPERMASATSEKGQERSLEHCFTLQVATWDLALVDNELKTLAPLLQFLIYGRITCTSLDVGPLPPEVGFPTSPPEGITENLPVHDRYKCMDRQPKTHECN